MDDTTLVAGLTTVHQVDDIGNSSRTAVMTNVTSLSPAWANDVKPYLDGMLLALVVIMMFSMGCEVAWENLVAHIKRPVSLCIGMLTQFVALPLLTFLVLVGCGVKSVHAAGILIVSCCPGGVLSNTFTYLCEGDLSLSIAMTTASTIVAMGMLPVNTMLYGRQFESSDLVIPYARMAISMIWVTSPALVGLAAKWKFPKGAPRLAKVGVWIGLVLIVIYTSAQVAILSGRFSGISATVHAVVLLLPLSGFTLGYGMASLTRQTPAVRKTIAIETGVQNLPLAVTIISLSFSDLVKDEILVIPFLYAFTMIGGSLIFCFAYSCFKKISKGDAKYLETPQKDIEDGYKTVCGQCDHHHVCTVNNNNGLFVKYSNGTATTTEPTHDKNECITDGEILLKQ